MLKKSFTQKIDRVQARKFAYIQAPHQDMEVIRHKLSKTALVCRKNSYFVTTPAGISSFYNEEDAVNSFLKVCALSEIHQPVRKKTIAHFQSNLAEKLASFTKTAGSLMDGDPWIHDAEMLIHKSSQDLWVLTSDNQYVARMFDPNKLVRE